MEASRPLVEFAVIEPQECRMQLLKSLQQRASSYLRQGQEAGNMDERQRYFELASCCFSMAARHAQCLAVATLPPPQTHSPETVTPFRAVKKS
jgi:hypothetical protein